MRGLRLGLSLTGGSGIPAPVLTWTSDATTYDPVFSLTGILEADVVELQIDNASDFASLFDSDSNTIDNAEALSGSVTFAGISSLTPGVTFYARARIQRGGVWSGWSNTVSKAMALPAFATDYTSAWAPTNLTRALAFASGPTGSTTADKFTETVANNEHSAYLTLASTAGARTVTAYFKDISQGFVFLQIAVDSTASRYAVVFNLATGAVTDTHTAGSPTGTGYSVVDVGGGWWRVVVNAVHTGGACYGVLGASDSATPTWTGSASPTYTGSATRAFLVAR